MRYSSEQINATFKQLPSQLQDAILSEDVQRAFCLDCDLANLDDDMQVELGNMVVATMVGVCSHAELYNFIGQNLGLDAPTSSMLTQRIEADVLKRFTDLSAQVLAQKARDGVQTNSYIAARIKTIADVYNRFIKLPAEVQQAIVDERTASSCTLVRNRYSLSETQFDVFMSSLLRAAVGAGTTRDFERTIREQLGVDTEIVDELLQQVEDSIFKPIHNTILTTIGSRGGVVPTTTPPPTKQRSTLDTLGDTPTRNTVDPYHEPL